MSLPQVIRTKTGDIRKKVNDLKIKEMSLKEKYDKLYDSLIFKHAVTYAFNKEHGTLDNYLDFSVEHAQKMMDPMLKSMKTVATSKILEQIVNDFMHSWQITQPLKNLELYWVSDREVAIIIKNCEWLGRL